MTARDAGAHAPDGGTAAPTLLDLLHRRAGRGALITPRPRSRYEDDMADELVVVDAEHGPAPHVPAPQPPTPRDDPADRDAVPQVLSAPTPAGDVVEEVERPPDPAGAPPRPAPAETSSRLPVAPGPPPSPVREPASPVDAPPLPSAPRAPPQSVPAADAPAATSRPSPASPVPEGVPDAPVSRGAPVAAAPPVGPDRAPAAQGRAPRRGEATAASPVSARPVVEVRIGRLVVDARPVPPVDARSRAPHGRERTRGPGPDLESYLAGTDGGAP